MNNPKVSIPATISKITTMADRGIRLQVDTQEVSDEQSADIFKFRNKLGYFFFDEVLIKEIDTSKLPKIELEEGEKSPSQRLRATLFVYWEQKKLKDPFDIFYRRTVEKYIGSIKEKLD